MSTAAQHEQMMSLARRALAHQQNKTTDQTDSVMSKPIETYTDESRYTAERERVFKTLPLALALTAELPNPGDFKTMDALDTPVLIARGDDGIARAFLNVCRHRGARVCESQSGNARHFACPYHAWVYSREGELTSRYGEKVFGEVNESELGLSQLGCAESAGIIWVTLGSKEAFDPSVWLGGMKQQLESLHLEDWYIHETRELIGPGWKVTMDGYLEIYHHNSVHGATVGQHTIGNLLVLDTYGPHQRLTLARKTLGTLADTPESEWEPLQHIRLVHNCYPNLSISGILGDHCLVSQIFPGPTPDTTRTIQMVLAAKQPTTDAEKEATQLFSDMVLQAVRDEDYHLGLLIQQGIKSGANHQFLYGKNEPAVQNYHNWTDYFMRHESGFDWSDQGGSDESTVDQGASDKSAAV